MAAAARTRAEGSLQQPFESVAKAMSRNLSLTCLSQQVARLQSEHGLPAALQKATAAS